MTDTRFRYPVWVRGDLDGFFGLMVDNLVQVLTIVFLCTVACGLPAELVFTRILPGVAISLIIGNLFYGIQAHYVARKYRKADTTALPYGINTPSVFAFAFFVIAPVYGMHKDDLGPEAAADLAWKAGLLACLVSGVIEFVGAFFAEKLRRVTPRAALLGVLAGVGIALIASEFAFRIYTKPLIGLLPLAILLLAYFGRYRFPLGLPGGLLVVGCGTVLAWGMSYFEISWFGGTDMSSERLRTALDQVRFIQPTFYGKEVLAVLTEPSILIPFLTVSIPMGLLNVLGSLQNIESAEAAGDKYATAPSLAVNGLGTIAAGLFGSCFPTTIYIGHPAWKSMGAKAGYSVLNGAFFTLLFLFGCGTFLSELIPIEAGAAIVMYIGIIITAQAFQATPREHAPAVAIALFPGLAACLVIMIPLILNDSNASLTLAEMMTDMGPTSQLSTLPGLLALFGANAGWMISALILTAIAVAFIEKRYKAATIWCAIATVLTVVGLLHSYRIEDNAIREFFIWQPDPVVATSQTAPVDGAATTQATTGVEPTAVSDLTPGKHIYSYRAYPVAVGYALATLVFALAAVSVKKREQSPSLPGTEFTIPIESRRIAAAPPILLQEEDNDLPPPEST